jgi:cell wall-associated NlpC family hydrolase
MPANRYVPKHRAIKESATKTWKRVAAVGATVPTALATGVAVGGPAMAASQRQEKIHNALEVARNQKGDPYSYGGDGPGSFDCSGLVQYSYGKSNIKMPRTTDAQAGRARTIAKEDMRKGDLMFFEDGGDVYHVGIFGGWNGHQRRRVLHAPNEGEDVHTELVWTNGWHAATMRGA